MRRLRRSDALRALVRETTLEPGDLIYPLFICPGNGVRNAIGSMPGVFNLSVDEAVKEAEEAARLGIGGLLLFGLPESKDEQGTGAWDENGIVQQALRALKATEAAKKLVLIADVCLCEYTSHGHCGVVVEGKAGFEVDNDPTLELLARTAVSQAQAGADVVAPSDMMDGRVAAIRRGLDAAGLRHDAHSQLCVEVCVGILRAVPRGCRFRSAVRRPAQLPDGRGQSARSHARDSARPE